MNILSNMKVKTKALLTTAGTLLLVLIVNAALNISLAIRTYEEALLTRAAVLADTVRKDVEKSLAFGLAIDALPGTSERLKELTDLDRDVSRIVVMDRGGKILYASDSRLAGSVLTDEATRDALAAAGSSTRSYRDAAGKRYYEKVIPLKGVDAKAAGVLRIAMKPDSVNRQVRGLVTQSLVVGLASFLVATIFVYLFVGREITAPLAAMSDNAHRIAAGDLSAALDVRGKSEEIARLGDSITMLARGLRDMLGRLQQTSQSITEAVSVIMTATKKISNGARIQQESTDQTATTVQEMAASIRSVAEHAAEMKNLSADAASSVTEMAASIEEVAKSASDLASSTHETASSITEMLASIRQVAEHIDTLSTSAEQTSSAITEMSASVRDVEQRALESARLAEKVSDEASQRGLAAADEAIRGMDHIRGSVDATATVLNGLGRRTKEIGQILKVIDEVADQTGLLALNAAILAAQAGEHGKGFAVVAEEIKDLAERTASSTQEIAGLITAVQKESDESLQAMDRGRTAVEHGAELVRVTRDVLQEVAQSSRRSADMARSIQRTTSEQARGIAQITEASMNITQQIEQIARAMKEQRRGSEQIGMAAERMRDVTHRVKRATEEQTAGSRQIAAAVDAVTAQAAQVAKATAEQRQGAAQITDAVGKIQRITSDSVDLSIELDMAMAALRERAAALQEELDKFRL